jgi:hypothetical protein
MKVKSDTVSLTKRTTWTTSCCYFFKAIAYSPENSVALTRVQSLPTNRILKSIPAVVCARANSLSCRDGFGSWQRKREFDHVPSTHGPSIVMTASTFFLSLVAGGEGNSCERITVGARKQRTENILTDSNDNAIRS